MNADKTTTNNTETGSSRAMFKLPSISENRTDAVCREWAVFSAISCDVDNLMCFWASLKRQLPLLAEVARNTLYIPATSARNETNFKNASTRSEKRRSNISPITLEASLLVQENYNALRDYFETT